MGGRSDSFGADRFGDDGWDSVGERRERRPSWIWLVILLLVWVLIGFGLRAFYAGEVLPGTEIADTDLAGLTEQEAQDRLGSLPLDPVTLTHEDTQIRVDAEKIGLQLDADASAERAIEAGRGGIPLRLLTDPLLPLSFRDVEPVVKVKRGKVDKVLDRAAKEVDVAPFAGALQIDRKAFEVSAEAPEGGQALARKQARRAVVRGLLSGETTVELPVKPVRAPKEAGVQQVVADAEAYLQQPLNINGAGKRLVVPPKRVAKVLAIEPDRSGRDITGVQLGTDEQALGELVEWVSAQRRREGRNAEVKAPGQPATVDNKADFSWKPRSAKVEVKKGRAGRQVEAEGAAAAISKAIRRGRHAAKVPVERIPPEVPTDQLKRIDNLIGTFTTYHSCCEPRVTNIQQMAKALDNIVIMPGQQFSANGLAGERTKEKGYVAAPQIEGGELKPAVGGGVSQYATTMYNAAYFAGLPINAFQPHSIYISRYPAGREATLDFGSLDLAWTNDTDAPILIRNSATDTSITVSLYGDNGGRKVTASSDRPAGSGAFSITVTREIKRGKGNVERIPVTTTYTVLDEDE